MEESKESNSIEKEPMKQLEEELALEDLKEVDQEEKKMKRSVTV